MIQKILMVCLGNICRSPVAEGIMRAKLAQYGLPVEVDSAGTSNYHTGENPDQRSIRNAAKNGIDICKLKARQFQVSDFDAFDVIYVMDNQNFNDVLGMARNEADKNKVKLILSELSSHQVKHVPDPYFGGEDGFQTVFNLLDEACENITRSISNQSKLIKQ